MLMLSAEAKNSHIKMKAKCGSKKTHAINIAKFCYFVIFARFEGSDVISGQ